MRRLAPAVGAGETLDVLLLGAHSDDIEIGAGGTVLRWAREYPGMRVRWVVFSAAGERADEARRSAERFLEGVADKRVEIHEFRNGYFPWVGGGIKDRFEELKTEFDPDVVFTHRLRDAHQDHRTLAELTWNTWRDHLVLEYEIPKYDGDLGQPNLFVGLEDDIVEKKIELLLDGFPTQRGRHWFTDETFRGLMRLRGTESACRFAEAFEARKLVW